MDAKATTKEEQDDDTNQEYIYIDVKDKKKEKHKVNTGEIWSLKLIEFLWKQLRVAWDARNKEVHSKDNKAAQQR